MDNQQIFDHKINSFISKFYKNKLIKGLIFSVSLFAIIILSLSYIEYVAWSSSKIRFLLFLLGLSSFSLIFIYFLFIPLSRLLGIFKKLSKKDAAKIIKSNVSEIDDSIINIIELRDLNTELNPLITASIVQKIDKIENINFLKAVNYKDNLKFLRYFLLICLISIITGIFIPDVFKDGSKRIIHYNLEYNKNLGFVINIDNDSLVVERGDDLEVSLNISGKEYFGNIELLVNGNYYLAKKISKKSFSYKFKNLNQSFVFYIVADKYKSKANQITVLASPIIKEFFIDVNYPSYTGLNNTILKNESNLKVPEGTNLTWKFKCSQVDSLFFLINDSVYSTLLHEEYFEFKKSVVSNFSYTIKVFNKNLSKEYLFNSKILVIKDLYPNISLDYIVDEKNYNLFYFKGNIDDDYGFHKLIFNVNNVVYDIPIIKNSNSQEYYYAFNFSEIDSESFDYYFEVFDNDIPNNFKSTKSKILNFSSPSSEEIEMFENEKDSEIFKDLESSFLMAKELEFDIKEFKNRVFSDDLNNWEKNELIRQLSSKQQKLEKLLENIRNNNLQKNNKLNSFSKNDEELINKQNEIQELLDNIFDDELKDLLNQMQDLQKELSEEDIKEIADKIEFKYDDLAKELDKNLELLKKLKIENEIQDIIDDLFEISEEESKLSKELNSNIIDSLTKKFEKEISELSEKYDSLFSENDNLENSLNLENFEDDFNQLQNDLNETIDEQNLKNKQDKSKNNSDKSKKLAENIQNMMKANNQSQNAENAETLRQILENLFYFSFDEERIENRFKLVSRNDPNYFKLVKSQQNLASNFEIIKDSLYALSKRSANVGIHIKDKVFEIENNLYKAERNISDNKIGSARNDFRNVITNSNDLILILSESLKNMDSMSGGGGGGESSSKKKKKPSKGEPSMSEMRSIQQGLKEQMQNMLNQMQKGGKSPGTGQLGQMLAKQEIFQQMLNKIGSKSGVSNEVSKILNEISKMVEQNRKDILNNNFGQQTLLRENRIETRLLEAENAEQEREIDEKRKANEAFEYKLSNPEEKFNELKQNNNFNEILDKNNLKLKYFYKNKYQNYIKNLNTLPNEKRN